MQACGCVRDSDSITSEDRVEGSVPKYVCTDRRRLFVDDALVAIVGEIACGLGRADRTFIYSGTMLTISMTNYDAEDGHALV